ncbi:MAG: 30S ribosomal protein S13 [Nitrospinota bacterium]
MARVGGVEIPNEKRLEVALTYIYGIGRATSHQIIQQAEMDPNVRVRNLTEAEISQLREIIERNHRIEGDVRRELSQNIKRLMDISSYRGLRHRKGLPVRGQRTHTNARTKKGPRRAIGGKKK